MRFNNRSGTDSYARIRPLVGRSIADVERDLIVATMAQCCGNRSWAADLLGLSVAELCERLRAFESDRIEIVAAKQPDEKMTSDVQRAMLAQFKPRRRFPS